MVKNPPVKQEAEVPPLGQKDSLKKEVATRSSILSLENSMDKGDWWATLHGVASSQMT